jgi:hypothetical protein
MRNPWLDQTPGPKRKGRAVISHNIFSKNLSASFAKSCKNDDNTTPAIVLTTGMTGAASFTASLPLVVEQPLISSLYLPLRASRAPPTPAS